MIKAAKLLHLGPVWVCSIALFSAGCAGHKGPPPSTDIDEAGFREHVRVLASDDFEGRQPGTAGEEKTVAYLTAQFRKLGLKPANGESYLQQVSLVELRAGGEPTLVLTRGGTTRRLAFARDMVIWTKRAVPATSLQHSDVVFVGYGIVAPEYDWNDYAAADVRGKTVVVLVSDPGHGTHDPQVFKGNTMTYYGRWTYKVEEAARHGAAGVLLIHDTEAAGYGWNVIASSWTGPQLELAAADGNAHRAAIEGWLSNDSARALFTLAGVEYGVATAAAAHPGFKPLPLGVAVDAELHNSIRQLNSANLVAVLPGARRKHEYVMYTAHWDHLGKDATGVIFHGAVDNASGVAGLLELAQSFSRTQPPADRSIAFVAFTGAEAGLLGSAYYVDNPLIPLAQTVGVINLDALHVGGPTRDVMVMGYGNSEMEDTLRSTALLQGRETHPEPNPEQGLYFRSDQFSFARAGVPALYAKAGIDDSARGPAWGQTQLHEFMVRRYHQPADSYSSDWDVRGTLDDLSLYYEVGLRLARSRHFPRWYPNSEFRNSPPQNRESGVD